MSSAPRISTLNVSLPLSGGRISIFVGLLELGEVGMQARSDRVLRRGFNKPNMSAHGDGWPAGPQSRRPNTKSEMPSRLPAAS